MQNKPPFATMSLSEKVALITGAGSGIGAAITILFSQEGANVILVGRNEAKLHDVANKCETQPFVIKADVTNDEDSMEVVTKVIDRHGKLDVLINNAGIVRYGSVRDDNALDTYDEVMNTNLRAVFNLTNLAIPHLIESRGNIINISSVAGQVVPTPLLLAYSVSKAGLDHFTRGVAMDMAPFGVRVNAISPGPVKTDILENAGSDTPWDVVAEATALGKVGDPEEIANLALFLASDKAKSVTGSIYVCDNGMLLK